MSRVQNSSGTFNISIVPYSRDRRGEERYVIDVCQLILLCFANETYDINYAISYTDELRTSLSISDC